MNGQGVGAQLLAASLGGTGHLQSTVDRAPCPQTWQATELGAAVLAQAWVSQGQPPKMPMVRRGAY